MDSNRFFLLSAEVYEFVRTELDRVMGHPNGKAETCMPPAAEARKWNDTRCIAAVLRVHCDWPEVSPRIAQLLSTGAAEEITAEAYAAAQPIPTIL